MYLYIIFFFPRFEDMSINLEPLISCWKRLVEPGWRSCPTAEGNPGAREQPTCIFQLFSHAHVPIVHSQKGESSATSKSLCTAFERLKLLLRVGAASRH